MPWKTVLMDMSNIATLNESHVQPRLRLMRRDVAEAVPETVGEAVGMTVGAMVGATVDTMVGAGGLVIGDGFMSGLGGYLDSGIGGGEHGTYTAIWCSYLQSRRHASLGETDRYGGYCNASRSRHSQHFSVCGRGG